MRPKMLNTFFTILMCAFRGRTVLATLLLGGFGGLEWAESAEPVTPDMILINCDDLGWGDLSGYGSTAISTPNIDRMADEGLRLTSFYVAQPICTASRAALMTGCYAHRVGLHQGVLRPNAIRGLAGEEVTLAEVLRDVGYATAIIGKWHLGFVEPFRPTDQGFDSYLGIYHNLDAHETVYFEDRRLPWIEQTEPSGTVDNTAITKLYGDAAVRRCGIADERPMFLYLAHAFPHVPLGVADEFRGRSRGGLYGDSIEQIDHETGRLIEAVRGRMRRTGRQAIVIFTSDNGPSPISSGSAGPFQGTKHTSWEGGLRVPFVIWGPGLIPSGRTSRGFVSSMDVLPSLAALVGGTLPSDRTVDGLDASEVFFAASETSPRTEMLFHNGGGALQGLRSEAWKVRSVAGRPAMLFHLEKDPGEAHDLATKYPRRTKKMVARAKELSAKLHREARPAGQRSDLAVPHSLSPVYDVTIGDLSPASIERAEQAAASGINVAAYVQNPESADEPTRRRLSRSGIPLRKTPVN